MESKRQSDSKAAPKTHRDLVAWRESMQLLVETYRVVARLPDIERYGLGSQLRRAAVSIPANIAEGFGRSTRGDYLRHLSIALGSLRELQTLLEAVILLEYLATGATKAAESASHRTAFLLYRLKRRLSAR
jgi:four helix bundle protein